MTVQTQHALLLHPHIRALAMRLDISPDPENPHAHLRLRVSYIIMNSMSGWSGCCMMSSMNTALISKSWNEHRYAELVTGSSGSRPKVWVVKGEIKVGQQRRSKESRACDRVFRFPKQNQLPRFEGQKAGHHTGHKIVLLRCFIMPCRFTVPTFRPQATHP